jgi:hypothetical protein
VEDAVRVGLGLTFHPLDDQDPRLDLLTDADRARGETKSVDECLNEATTLFERSLGPELDRQMAAWTEEHPSATHGEIAAERQRRRTALRLAPGQAMSGEAVNAPSATFYNFQTEAEGCVEEWRNRQARRPNLLIAIGQTFVSSTGQSDDLDSEGVTAWVGYSRRLPLDRLFPSFSEENYSSRVNLYARYAEEETVAVDEDTSALAQVGVAAISLNLANIGRDTRNWQFGLEAAYRTEEYSDATLDREYTQLAVNAAVRINDGLWLRAAYGTRNDDEESEFFRLSFVIAERAKN